MRALAFAFLALLVTSCGQQVCVGGLGDCGYDPATAPKSTGTSTQSGSGQGIYISATASAIVTVGQTLEFRTVGGRSPYTYEMTYPSNRLVGKIDFSSGSNCIYTAPAQLTSPQTRQEIRIRAKDADGKMSIEFPFLVIATP